VIHNYRRLPVLALGGMAMAGVLAVTPSSGARSASAVSAVPAGAVTKAASLPAPPRFDVRANRPGTAPGLFFTTPQSPKAPQVAHGPEIMDGKGRPVWFQQLPSGDLAADLRLQRYQGRPVMTWWQGTFHDGSNGHGVGYIADEHYHVIATVKGVTGPADLHEFRLTSRGTALLTEYQHVKADLTEVGGPKDGEVLNAVVEEIDVATGKALFKWSSLDHVPITETDFPYIASPDNQPYDYFHLNSVDEDTDGNLLISGRYLSTIFKVDRHTGKIIWRLGGRHSTFPLGIGVRFYWPHAAVSVGKNTVQIFDNGCLDLWAGYESRVAWVRIDPVHKTTKLIKQVIHPEHLSTVQEGNGQALPNGDTAVSWGTASRISEFSPRGKVLFDASLPTGWSSYRIYRFPWKGMPDTPPVATVEGGSVHAVWNGATGVTRWRLVAGDTEDAMRPVAQTAWNGLDTAIALPPSASAAKYVKVEALDAKGAVMRSSAAAPTGR
jgi:hypothetical protein